MLTIDIRTSGFAEARAMLERAKQGLADKAIASALNKTTQGAQTQMVRGIAAEFNIKQADIRAKLSLRRANRNDLQTTLFGNVAGGKQALNVIRFLNARATRTATRSRKSFGLRNELRFQIRKGSAPAAIDGAFIGNDGRTVFMRVGKKRLPIKAVTTVGVPQMFARPRVQKPVIAWIQQNFTRIFEQDARYFLSTLK